MTAAGKFGGIEAEVADGVGDADAVAVRAREGRGVQFADQRKAAEKRLGEAHALLFGEADDFDREGETFGGRSRAAFFDQLLYHGYSEDHAEDAVERRRH